MRAIPTLAGLLFAGTLVLSVAPTGRAEEPASPSSPPTTAPVSPAGEHRLGQRVKDLSERVRDLEQENRRLKARVRDLESRGPILAQPPRVLPVPAPRLHNPPAVPRHWVPREFNGETFYLIPLKSGN